MVEMSLELLRGFELRLLRCSLLLVERTILRPSLPTAELQQKTVEFSLRRCSLASVKSTIPLPSPPATELKEGTLKKLIENIVSLIEDGNYLQALSSEAVRLVFGFADSWTFQDSIDCADRFYGEVEKSVGSFLSTNNKVTQDGLNWSSRAFLLLCIAVAAFMAFTQINVTGPIENFPLSPLPLWKLNEDKVVSCRMEWDMWARNQLRSGGSDLSARYSITEYMVYAKMLLMKTKDMLMERKDCSLGGTRTISWWLSRLILLQQIILDEKSSSLFDLLQVLMRETLNHFGTLENVTSYWGTTTLDETEASTIVTMAHLHAENIEYIYGRTNPCRKYLTGAEEAAGLQLSVTGVLGFRTVHQVEAKAQMVLVVNTNMSGNGDVGPATSPEHQKNVCSFGEDPRSSETYGASDILMTPKLMKNAMEGGIGANSKESRKTATIPLSPSQQAVILAKCLLIKKSTSYGELQSWDMAPYIEALDAQKFSYYLIRRSCDFLRIRWESTRSRTKERALMMMEKLVNGLHESLSGAAKRIPFSYDVYVYTIPMFQKKYGELLVSCNMISEALKIFEDMELWDNVIYCYCRLGKKASAVELINRRLLEMPNDSRLWCCLGDVTANESHYKKALKVSNNRSTRAMRSLARSACDRRDYEASKALCSKLFLISYDWESAMALNSFYPRGWHELGAVALMTHDIEKALDAFTRVVQLDPNDGLAWSQIAFLHMQKKRNKEAFVAIKEAVKFRRNCWRLWKGYSYVAVETGNFRQALEATKLVLELTKDELPKNEHINAQLLESVIMEMEARASKRTMFSVASGTIQALPGDCIGASEIEGGMMDSWENDRLLELLENVLKQIDSRYDGENIWGLCARWHKFKGDLTMCSEALQKQVRSYEGSELWKNEDKFKKFATTCLQLLKVYMEIYLSTGNCRELEKAEKHLRTKVVQAMSCFSDTRELKDLKDYLDEVNMQLQAN